MASGNTVTTLKRSARWLGLLFVLCCIGQVAAAPDQIAQREINHLLTRLETSDCRFFRNDNWYSAKRARKHLEKKLAWLAKRDLVASAEQFIERAATKSSRSGKAYLVQCGGGLAAPSAVWLLNELDRNRQAATKE